VSAKPLHAVLHPPINYVKFDTTPPISTSQGIPQSFIQDNGLMQNFQRKHLWNFKQELLSIKIYMDVRLLKILVAHNPSEL
jgi:hypothetical protein